MSGLSPAARKELASLSPEERVEALRALVATDSAEVIAHAVERDPWGAVTQGMWRVSLRLGPCEGPRFQRCIRGAGARACPAPGQPPYDRVLCLRCCEGHACEGSVPLFRELNRAKEAGA